MGGEQAENTLGTALAGGVKPAERQTAATMRNSTLAERTADASGEEAPSQERTSEIGGRSGTHGTHEIGEPKSVESEAMKKAIEMIFHQLDHYQRSRGGALTSEQEDFLALYRSKGSSLLETSRGQALANCIIEREMLLRLAVIQKNLFLELSKQAPQGKDTWIIQEQERPVLKRLWHKYGERYGLDTNWQKIAGLYPGMIPVLELHRRIAQRKPGVAVNLRDFQFATGGIPDEYQQYISYLNPTLNVEKTRDFLKFALDARIAFYESLGYDKERFQASTPFERIQPASGGQTYLAQMRENLDTEWVRVRNQALERLASAQGVNLTNPEHATRVFFLAQEETIRHFLNLYIVELSQIKLGGEPPGSISILNERKDRLSSPEGQATVREKMETEKSELENQVRDWRSEIKTNEGIIRQKVRELARVKQKAPRLNTRLTILHTDLNTLESEFATATADKTTQEQACQAILADPQSTDQQKAAAQAGKTNAGVRWERIQVQISACKDKIAEIDVQLGEIDGLAAEIEELKEQNNKLQKKIGKTEKSPRGALKSIAELERQLKGDLDQLTQEKVDQLEAAVGCLRDYDRVVGEPVFEAEKGLSVQTLTDRTIEQEYGANYSKGYLKILEHVFQYGTAAKREAAFKAAGALLSPEDLSNILNIQLNLGISISDLDEVFKEIANRLQANKLGQADFGPVFLAVLLHIEGRAKRIEEEK